MEVKNEIISFFGFDISPRSNPQVAATAKSGHFDIRPIFKFNENRTWIELFEKKSFRKSNQIFFGLKNYPDYAKTRSK